MLELQAARRPPPMDQANAYGQSRSGTTSANYFPSSEQQQQPQQHHHPQHQQFSQSSHLNPGPQHAGQQRAGPQMHTRRTPSVNTFSTTSSFHAPAAYRTSSQSDLRRSISSRSGGTAAPQASGYVALLRKQKATVWCDRAQYEDPRTAHQQKVAKMRAHLEVSGGRNSTYGSMGGRTSTGISATGKVVGKIRNHGKLAVSGYTPGENHVGVGGVPMRLSATEVEGEDSDEDISTRPQHRRTGSSGRSSTASGKRVLAYRTSGGPGSRKYSPGDTPERRGSMAEDKHQATDDGGSAKAQSVGSGSSAERADNVGELGNPQAPKLASNSLLNAALTREKSVRNPEELKRRGSVDERTATLTSGRLFIANPD